MNRVFCGTLLLFASITFAQQQGRPPVPLPDSTPPTFPEAQQNPRTPPDVPSPAQSPGEVQRPAQPSPDERPSNPEVPPSRQVAQYIQQQFDREPLLKEAGLKVVVDNATITLTGAVGNEQQHQMALRIVAPFGDERNIVDKIKVRT